MKGINCVSVWRLLSADAQLTIQPTNAKLFISVIYITRPHCPASLLFLPYFCLSLSLKIPAQMCENASVSLSHQVKMMMVVVVVRMRMVSFHGDSDRQRCDHNLTFSLSFQEVNADKWASAQDSSQCGSGTFHFHGDPLETLHCCYCCFYSPRSIFFRLLFFSFISLTAICGCCCCICAWLTRATSRK